MVEVNEPPRSAAERELWEELGATIIADGVLVLDWVGPHGPWDDQLVLVFDGGALTTEQANALHVADPELTDYAFLPPDQATRRLRADVADRLHRAFDRAHNHPHPLPRAALNATRGRFDRAGNAPRRQPRV